LCLEAPLTDPDNFSVSDSGFKPSCVFGFPYKIKTSRYKKSDNMNGKSSTFRKGPVDNDIEIKIKIKIIGRLVGGALQR